MFDINFELFYRTISLSHNCFVTLLAVPLSVATSVCIWKNNKKLNSYQSLVIFFTIISALDRLYETPMISTIEGYFVYPQNQIFSSRTFASISHKVHSTIVALQRICILELVLFKYFTFCKPSGFSWFKRIYLIIMILYGISYLSTTYPITSYIYLCHYTCLSTNESSFVYVETFPTDTVLVETYTNLRLMFETFVIVMIMIYCNSKLSFYIKDCNASKKNKQMHQKMCANIFCQYILLMVQNMAFIPILSHLTSYLRLYYGGRIRLIPVYGYMLLYWYQAAMAALIYDGHRGFIRKRRKYARNEYPTVTGASDSIPSANITEQTTSI